VTLGHFLLLVLAGIGAGLVGSVAGIASMISYPALLAAGLSPVTANVTNTVSLVFQGAASIHGSLPELRGERQRQLARRLVIWAVLGGIVGGVLLLRTPSEAFARIVPVLIGGSALAILIPRRPIRADAVHAAGESVTLRAGVFLIGIYGGYFGAAAGVMLLALLLTLTDETLPRSSAVRTVLLSSANAVAAGYFIAFGDVRWSAVLPLALGLMVGGRTGPIVLRRAPAGPVRVVIALAGLALSIRLGLDAYR
jgi:uncharacterized membrane protein YfcA